MRCKDSAIVQMPSHKGEGCPVWIFVCGLWALVRMRVCVGGVCDLVCAVERYVCSVWALLCIVGACVCSVARAWCVLQYASYAPHHCMQRDRKKKRSQCVSLLYPHIAAEHFLATAEMCIHRSVAVPHPVQKLLKTFAYLRQKCSSIDEVECVLRSIESSATSSQIPYCS